LISGDKKQMQKKVQGKYRRSKQQYREAKKIDEKEFIIIAIIVFLILLLNAMFKGF